MAAECVTLNILVIGDTLEQAHAKLDDAIGGYLCVATQEADWSGLIPRHAGITSYFWYSVAWYFTVIRDARTAFALFQVSPPEMLAAC